MDDQQIDRALTSALRRAKRPAAADVDVRDCVDAERLAAWSAGALSVDDAAGVERHLATCVRCQDVAAVFAETAEPVAAAALPATVQAPVSKILRRWMAPLAAAAAVVVWVAWPRPNPPVMPADTMARVQPPPPRAETPPPPASPAPSSAVVPPAPVAPTTQGGAAAPKPGQSARDAATADQMKAVARSDRSLLQDQRRADPKPAPPQRAQPSTLPPPPAPSPSAPATAPVPAPTATPVPPPPATATVLAPPPPPAPTAPPPTAAREFRAPAMAESLDPRSVVAQFSSAMPAGVAGGAVAAAGRGGGGGAAANRQIAMDGIAVTKPVPHWRVLASGTLERSTDGGATWSAVPIDPPAHITSGAAPTPAICWLVGRSGVVLISTNFQPFVRVTPPTAGDLASIRATSARDATVTTTDGRSFRTTDGGVTWVPV